MKICLPWRTASSKCDGRNPGGVARITTSAMRDGMLIGVEADEFVLFRHIDAVGVIGFEVVVAAVQPVFEASAMATSLSGPSVLRAWLAAPEPRPPQPISANFSVSSLGRENARRKRGARRPGWRWF